MDVNSLVNDSPSPKLRVIIMEMLQRSENKILIYNIRTRRNNAGGLSGGHSASQGSFPFPVVLH